jgi:hypothetical protein
LSIPDSLGQKLPAAHTTLISTSATFATPVIASSATFAIGAAFLPAFGLVSKLLDSDKDEGEDGLESKSKSEEEEEPPG